MTAEHYVALAVGLIAASAVILGPILLYLVRLKHENAKDHGRVVTAVDVLTAQVATLTHLVTDSVAELRAHVKWEETKKYVTIEELSEAVQTVQVVNPGEVSAGD